MNVPLDLSEIEILIAALQNVLVRHREFHHPADPRILLIQKMSAQAHRARSPVKAPDLKWEEKETNRMGISPHEADYSDSVFLTAEKHWFGEQWLWRVEYVGEAANEAEAKAKAIEYAGRLP